MHIAQHCFKLLQRGNWPSEALTKGVFKPFTHPCIWPISDIVEGCLTLFGYVTSRSA